MTLAFLLYRLRIEDIQALVTEERYLEAISEFRVLLTTLKNGQNWEQQVKLAINV